MTQKMREELLPEITAIPMTIPILAARMPRDMEFQRCRYNQTDAESAMACFLFLVRLW